MNTEKPDMSDAKWAWIEAVTEKCATGNSTLQIEKGITAEQMEAVYAHAYGLFEAGKYDDAKAVFEYLALHDPIEAKYLNALGCCHEELKNYEKAAAFYLQALLLSDQDARPGYRSALCLRTIGKIEEAEGALHLTIEHTINSEENAPIKELAALMRDELEQLSKENSADN